MWRNEHRVQFKDVWLTKNNGASNPTVSSCEVCHTLQTQLCHPIRCTTRFKPNCIILYGVPHASNPTVPSYMVYHTLQTQLYHPVRCATGFKPNCAILYGVPHASNPTVPSYMVYHTLQTLLCHPVRCATGFKPNCTILWGVPQTLSACMLLQSQSVFVPSPMTQRLAEFTVSVKIFTKMPRFEATSLKLYDHLRYYRVTTMVYRILNHLL
jgi:hypothetical protein